ncbi:MAG: peptidoglycan DD-metalloendopeptidase family protein [Bacilli bacterium]|nr:peptidoglycan DD-metalloendopeptidase family protein [Bacilli bacterium]
MDGQVLMHTDEVVTQSYSSYHKAIDVVGEGHSVSDVIAVSDGTVEIAVSTVTTNNQNARGTASYGNFVKIKHDDGTKSLYAHLKPGSVSVKAGERISKGDKIGTMGNTGNAHGVHLHFEVRNSDETRMNPTEYISKKQAEPVLENNKVDSNESKISSDVSTPALDNSSVKTVTSSSVNSNVGVERVTKKVSDSKTVISSNDIDNNNIESEFISNSDYKYGSIVDGLKSIGIDSSFNYRTLLAHENGIDDYHGTYNQNVYLLSLLKQGKLKKV